MIDHPAFPKDWPHETYRNAGEIAFRALVEWLKEHNSADSKNGLRLWYTDWQSLLDAVKDEVAP